MISLVGRKLWIMRYNHLMRSQRTKTKDDDKMNLGKQIAMLRKAHKMSQEDLAAEVNVSRQAVTKWERGEAVPELEKLISLADFFCVSLDLLVGRNETIYDKLKTRIDNMAAKCSREYEGDISPMIQWYMNFMEKLGMSADTIVEGLLAMCKDD